MADDNLNVEPDEGAEDGANPIDSAIATMQEEEGDEDAPEEGEEEIGSEEYASREFDAQEEDEETETEEGEEAEEEAETEDEVGEEEEAPEEGPDAEEGEEELVSFELPDSLKSSVEGLDDVDMIDVSESQAPLYKVLLENWHSTKELEDWKSEIETDEVRRQQELEEFRMLTRTQPFQIIDQVLGDDADSAFRHWLLSDDSRWNAHVSWMEELAESDDTLRLTKRELALAHKERIQSARDDAHATNQGRQAAKRVMERVDGVLDKIRPDDRDFVGKQIIQEIRTYAAQQKEKTGSDIIDPEMVDIISTPWLSRFGKTTEEAAPSPAEEPVSDEVKAEAAKKRLRARAKARKVAKKTVTASGAPTARPAGPPKNITLDELLKKAEKGDVKI